MENWLHQEGIRMCKLLIFGGTTEGRLLAEYCVQHSIHADVSVATEYGASLLPGGTGVLVGRLDASQMQRIFQEKRYRMVIDATHPYAVAVTDAAKSACAALNIPYFRLVRNSEALNYGSRVESVEAAVSVLKQQDGVILSTLGSKELKALREIPDYRERIWARLLPSPDIVGYCTELGFDADKLILAKGPFTEEQNFQHIRMTNAAILLTKESGNAGGYTEKANACKRCHIAMLTISRPEESGCSFEEIITILRGEV